MRGDQVLELAEPPAAGVEVRGQPHQVAADRAQGRPAAVVGRRVHRFAQQRIELAIALERRLLPGLLALVARGGLVAVVVAQVLDVDELVAGGNEGLGGLAFAESVDRQSLLADARRQAGEVAVAGDDAEAVQVAAVHQVHRVDDQRAVGGVLAGGVVELLDRRDRGGEQSVLPAAQVARGPVAVGAADAGVAVLGDLRQQVRQLGRVAVVGVDQDREAGASVAGHRMPSVSSPDDTIAPGYPQGMGQPLAQSLPERPAIAFLASKAEGAQAALPDLERQYGQVAPEEADVLVALGGDGFMLQVLHRHGALGKPVYGMKHGGVGFLMNHYHRDTLVRRLHGAEPAVLRPLEMLAQTESGTTTGSLAYNEVSLLRQTRQAAHIGIDLN